MPFVPYTTERRLGKRINSCSGLSTFDQSILIEDISVSSVLSSFLWEVRVAELCQLCFGQHKGCGNKLGESMTGTDYLSIMRDA